MAYNGWKNRETWNCALWMANDYGLYQTVLTSASFDAFLDTVINDYGMASTPDNVNWTDGDRDELIWCFNELQHGD